MTADDVDEVDDRDDRTERQRLRGHVVVLVEDTADGLAVERTDWLTAGQTPHYLTVVEAQFGNYDSGRWAWILEDVRRVFLPLPCKGALHLWTVDGELLNTLERRLGATV